eukprot:6952101-Prymnesium_polylepis.1
MGQPAETAAAGRRRAWLSRASGLALSRIGLGSVAYRAWLSRVHRDGSLIWHFLIMALLSLIWHLRVGRVVRLEGADLAEGDEGVGDQAYDRAAEHAAQRELGSHRDALGERVLL